MRSLWDNPSSSLLGNYCNKPDWKRSTYAARDLARSANVSEAVYKGWEADQGHPNRLQLAKMLGCRSGRTHIYRRRSWPWRSKPRPPAITP